MTHIQRFIAGTTEEFDEWVRVHPHLPAALVQPDSEYRINPWDEVVYLESYYEGSYAHRNVLRDAIVRGRDRGRTL